ncbi:hypothetical protein OH491_23040 [Termitidicoccus mucosus]|uniref:DUF2946 domain-containing protein n=1 Tax=Termitidicoccus mucosus TaxID=1184151 RepID=A0A178IQC0_9BACT|nr:hypothetical protein AW736_03435 [Opitutaceae bacterium TSB47]
MPPATPVHALCPRARARRRDGVAMASAKRLTLIAAMLAWTLATGVQWDILQFVGWGRMIVAYSTEENSTLAKAITDTFSGERPCSICETVAQARQSDDTSVPPSSNAGKDSSGKIICTLPPAPFIVYNAPAEPEWFDADTREPASPAYPVPVPPPRA